MAEIHPSGPLDRGTTVGDGLAALIQVGAAADIVFLERPATARSNTTSTILVLETDGEHARRVTVRSGRQSGSLMEIVSGLSSGDRVIVTDMSQWAGYERLRLR